MRTSLAITIAVCSALYYAVTLVSGLEKRSYIDNEVSLPLTGDDLRILADKVDLYNALIGHIENTFPEQIKRGGGCRGFSACAQLAIGQDAFRNMMHNNRASIFTSARGPGRRKRSIDEQQVLPMSGDDFRLLAEEVELYNEILGQIASTHSKQFKRGTEKGCAGFSGCAQLAAGQSALQAMIHGNRASLFGSGGPGKRKRSTDEA
ncbi:uncharacterized protein [Amphiura filiformis]|uniref:uncharacterized protein n=1 Tax=Amphiura filiformis TaxID=82378 RepID=UPI003B2277F6